MTFIKLFGLLILLTVNSGISVNAADKCENFDAEPSHFISLYNDSKLLGKSICDTLGATVDLDSLLGKYVGFADNLDKTIDESFNTTSYYNDLKVQVKEFKSLSRLGVNKAELPYFRVTRNTTDFTDTHLYFSFDSWDTNGKVDTNSVECNKVPTCEELLTALEIAINQYKEPYVRLSAGATTKNISVLRKSWDRYFEEARSQTLWDAALTTKLEEDYLTQDKLVGPMQRQWFLVHPSLVIENVSDAIDGEETQQGLAVEWVGVNWWNKETSPVGIPIGVSLASIYSSRPTVDDSGHGVMFTFNNSFSIGWAKHDDEDGLYVSVDFLGLLTAKKERWSDYKDKIKELKFD